MRWSKKFPAAKYSRMARWLRLRACLAALALPAAPWLPHREAAPFLGIVS
jgi:hypothetical protein